MANGDFQKGTWNELPDNCTRSITLTWFRCAEYGLVFLTECRGRSGEPRGRARQGAGRLAPGSSKS